MVKYDENGTPKKNNLSLQIDLSKFEPATEEEKKQQDVMSKSSTFFRDGMRKLRKNPLAMASMIVLVLIIVLIIVAPLIIPYGYSEILSVAPRTWLRLPTVKWSRNTLKKEITVSRISSERMNSAAIILSASFTEPGFPWSSASSQA